MSTNRISITAVALAAAACALPAPGTDAAQWYAEPALSLTAGHEDNFFFTTTGVPQSQNIFTATPRLTLGSQTENSDVLASAYLTNYRYPGRDEINNTGGGANALWRLDYPRAGGDLNVGINRFVLRDYNNIDVDASRAVDDTTSRQLSVSPSFRWSFNERTNLRASVRHSDVEYDGTRANLYRDYRINAPSLTATYLFSEITQFFVTATDSRIEYTNTQVPLVSDTTSESLGVTTQLSERLDTTLSVGLRRTTTESQQQRLVCTVFVGSQPLCDPNDPNDPNFVTQLVDTETLSEGRIYSANLTWRYTNGSVAISASQDIVPSGQAAAVQGTNFSATFRHALTPMVSADLSLSSSRYRTDQDTRLLPSFSDYDFLRFEPGITWRLSETLSSSLRYGRSRQDYVDSGTLSTNNSIYLVLNWNPQRRYFSY